MTLTVAPGVFVPRPRTEHLAELVIERVRPGAVVVELCSGVAPVAAAVLANEHEAAVHAVDVDRAALACAERNLRGGMVHRGDLYAPLPRMLRHRVDIVVASPPYVPSGDIDLLPREARDHERRDALDGGTDGLDLHRRILQEAPPWLSATGQVLLECAEHQADALGQAFRRHGFSPQIAYDDEREATVVVGPLF
ncbi:methyltransferase [Nocardioides alcanivorans]|uniref:methyltransferase n=1 Tax=Nocardioides alcanivorans TaxID=2897352 RepID=UPI001F18FB33|nr:methyltransferase [Nocardioides alcanivorans]